MRKILKITSVFAFILMLSACSRQDESCVNPTLNVEDLEKLNACMQPSLFEVDLPVGDFVVVRSQTDFDKLFTPSECFNIDFSKNDLVVGKKELRSNLVSIDYTLTQDCKTNNLMLKVVFTRGLASVVSIVIYGTLIPKLQGEQMVTVTLND
ncbi:MAG TPA: hypothetical protein DCS93_39870 [Microscillaceae bacterium]|nr:hypothetical protein [Microscillaceae bacterium]